MTMNVGLSAHIIDVERIDRDSHSAVFRLRLGSSGTESVVLKRACLSDDERLDPDDSAPDGRAGRLWNEWAGLEFLSRTGGRLVTPRFLGGDRREGFVLLEDLGTGPSLADLLLGSDHDRAVAALQGYASALATIHLETLGRADEYERLRRAHGPIERRAPRVVGFAWDRLVAGLSSLDGGFMVPTGSAEAVRLVDSRVAEPGPFLAYSPNDCCPDNNRVLDDGTVRLFDLEYGGYRHALLDVGYFHSTMPTCWCVRRLSDGLADQLVSQYRREVTASAPAGLVEMTARFDLDLAICRVQWAIRAAAGHLIRLQREDKDPPRHWAEWDFWFCSQRELLGFRLEQLDQAARLVPALAPLAELAVAARARVAKSYGDLADVPLYPAFRSAEG